jgi:hypothetical protein
MNSEINIQKKKLEQKKARVKQQEIILKLKERKSKVRNLIELGSLVAKAQIDKLHPDILLGALLSLKETLNDNDKIIHSWKKIGQEFSTKKIKDKIAIILTFIEQPDLATKTLIRSHGLKWNHLRKEYYGYISSLEQLKDDLNSISDEISGNLQQFNLTLI